MWLKNAFSIYTKPAMLVIFFLGFSSGLPLALTASTLGVWLMEAHVSKSAIGLFAAISTPYALKFLWSPLIDAVSFPILSRLLGLRRGWMLATQVALAITIVALGFANPAINPWMTAFCALLVTICSASQDIVVDAYRVEILKPGQQGAGAAALVLGYRIGMIASSAGPLFMYATIGWLAAYCIMAALMAVGIATTLMAKEPDHGNSTLSSVIRHPSSASWMREHVIAPFADFMTRPHWVPILLLILLYKLPDAFMGVMTNPFLIGIGFTGPQIATILKVYGVIATIVGSFIGGSIVYRLGIMRSLALCGVMHMITNLLFVEQARLGADPSFLTLAITVENITGGMATAAFVAFISMLTNVRFTATQYALLSSFASFGRTWLSTPAGWFAEMLGWEWFFGLSSLLAIPGLLIVWYLSGRVQVDAKR